MKILHLTIIIFSFCSAAFAQKTKKREIYSPTVNEYDILTRRLDCLYRNNYSITQRLSFFPFNKYKKIILISFESPEPPRDRLLLNDGTKTVFEDTIPDISTLAKRYKFYQSVTKESKTLSSFDINKLTNILFNYGYKSHKSYNGIRGTPIEYRCYEPRNAILFIDKKDQLVEYIDLCFECFQYKTSSAQIKMGEICNQKFNLLQNFFITNGIKYVNDN